MGGRVLSRFLRIRKSAGRVPMATASRQDISSVTNCMEIIRRK